MRRKKLDFREFHSIFLQLNVFFFSLALGLSRYIKRKKEEKSRDVSVENVFAQTHMGLFLLSCMSVIPTPLENFCAFLSPLTLRLPSPKLIWAMPLIPLRAYDSSFNFWTPRGPLPVGATDPLLSDALIRCKENPVSSFIGFLVLPSQK